MITLSRKPILTQKPATSALNKPHMRELAARHPSDQILHLQRTIGNRAVQSLFQSQEGHQTQALARPAPEHSDATISSPTDAHEREADAMADRVMRMATSTPKHMAAAEPSYAKTQGGGRPGTLNRKVWATGVEPSSATGIALGAADKGGTPMNSDLREYFEPRFGHDLSHVRMHVGDEAAEGASAVQARAYTVGGDIVFGGGEYSPSTQEGKHLIAHELAHVVQLGRSPAFINRKIACDPQASLAGYFSGKDIWSITKSDNAYGHDKSGAKTFEQEILIDMLSSPRVFHVDGENNEKAAASLDAHVAARTGIVSFAAQKNYSFASLSGWKMNAKYYDWDTSKGTWKMKPDVDKQEAWDDLNESPGEYAIGCAAATELTQKGGSKGANFIDKPTSDIDDWVPGDAGYIENASYKESSGQIGLLGENIIYAGGGDFWGHFPGGVNYRTLADWMAEVKSWTRGGGKAVLKDQRELPATGLLDQ